MDTNSTKTEAVDHVLTSVQSLGQPGYLWGPEMTTFTPSIELWISHDESWTGLIDKHLQEVFMQIFLVIQMFRPWWICSNINFFDWLIFSSIILKWITLGFILFIHAYSVSILFSGTLYCIRHIHTKWKTNPERKSLKHPHRQEN